MERAQEIIEKCKSNHHQWIEIYNDEHDWSNDPYTVIKWCKGCGVLKETYELDGRLLRDQKFSVPQIIFQLFNAPKTVIENYEI